MPETPQPKGAAESGSDAPICSAILDSIVRESPGFAPLETRAAECMAMLEAVGCHKMEHGNTLTGMVQSACREIIRLRQNAKVVAPPPQDSDLK